MTDIGEVAEEAVTDPGDDKATYKLFVDGFPRYDGSVNGTLADVSPEVTVPIVGAVG